MVDYSVSGTEPPLREVMDDPIVKMLMKRDGVSADVLAETIAISTAQEDNLTAA